MKKLHLCTLTFTLITNLTPNFKKYIVIPSHLKKRTPRYPHHLKIQKCPLYFYLCFAKVDYPCVQRG